MESSVNSVEFNGSATISWRWPYWFVSTKGWGADRTMSCLETVWSWRPSVVNLTGLWWADCVRMSTLSLATATADMYTCGEVSTLHRMSGSFLALICNAYSDSLGFSVVKNTVGFPSIPSWPVTGVSMPRSAPVIRSSGSPGNDSIDQRAFFWHHICTSHR